MWIPVITLAALLGHTSGQFQQPFPQDGFPQSGFSPQGMIRLLKLCNRSNFPLKL